MTKKTNANADSAKKAGDLSCRASASDPEGPCSSDIPNPSALVAFSRMNGSFGIGRCSAAGQIVVQRSAAARTRPSIVPLRPCCVKQVPVLSLKQFPGALSDKAVQPIGFQPPATLICKNEKAEEIAVGLLMKVAAVPILRPEQRDDLVDNFVVCPLLRASHVLPRPLKLGSDNSRSARVYWRARRD